MLCQYTVKNYKSIKNEVTINLEALDITEFSDSLISYEDGEKYLPLSVIYGPNGGGKSNLIQSFRFLIHKITKPVFEILREDKEKNFQSVNNDVKAVPFKFDDNSSDKPSEFELYFRYENYEYHYKTEILGNYFLKEYLSRKRISSERYTNIFSRDDKEIRFYNSLSKYNLNENSNVSKDISLISYLRIMHNENAIVRSVYNWFQTGIIGINGTSRVEMDMYEYALVLSEQFKGYHEKIINMMQEMDIDVRDFEIVDNNGENEIYTKHVVNNIDRILKLAEESTGTRKLFGILSYICIVLNLGTTLLIDELDCNIHPKLLGYIMNLFSNKDINKNNAQLIFTSHDLVTMSNEYLRRDEIWFIAKDADESSSLYSLAEFKKENGKVARKDETYSKQYLEGRYGSDPYLQKIIKW